jgi:DNA helicase II / ATP-dependent DNA helicase PcrA
MRFIADMHIHSHFSRATSRDLNLEQLHRWAQLKGLTVIATGDITHPKWFEDIKNKLEPDQNGLFTLRQEYAKTVQNQIPASCISDVYFILSGEISTIYKRDGKVRKIHHVVFLPSFESVEKFQTGLSRIGNILSDGRPILGLDSRDLLDILLNVDEKAYLVPAHIWTPWFSIMGSKSGFDSIEECFGDLSRYIFALETGLSSDPPMNWRLSSLDPYSLISNSDAHSPAKLAREANVFQTDLTYDHIFSSLKIKSDDFWGTVEFFPEEGKYHMDGHRKCNHMMRPSDTLANNGLCPVCQKLVTLGVAYRVEELAVRPEGEKPRQAKPFINIIPLVEIIAEVKDAGTASKGVQTIYHSLLRELGPELGILIDLPLSDLEKKAGPLLSEAVRRMRRSEVKSDPGYDGEYGIIRIFDKEERFTLLQQKSFFLIDEIENPIRTEEPPPTELKARIAEAAIDYEKVTNEKTDTGSLNKEQLDIIAHRGCPLVIQAGPGTGKTRTLTHRLAELIHNGRTMPENILALTFTHKAAQEMRTRLAQLLGFDISDRLTIMTFHAFGNSVLRTKDSFAGRTKNFIILDPEHDATFKKAVEKHTGERLSHSTIEKISILKGKQIFTTEDIPKEILENVPANFLNIFGSYQLKLTEMNAVDYDDLVGLTLQLISKDAELRRSLLKKYKTIAVDEFQDINLAQYQLFRILAIAAQDVCIIGDPDQAIYGFRGASREFFHQFVIDFPHAKVLKLAHNYRSAQNILTASVQMLHNSHVDEAMIWSNLLPKVKINIHQAPTERAEAEFVVHQIEQLLGGTSHFSFDTRRVSDVQSRDNFSFSDIAILMRTKRLAAPLLDALNRSGMPHETFEFIPLSSDCRIQFIIKALKEFGRPEQRDANSRLSNFAGQVDGDHSLNSQQFKQAIAALSYDASVTEFIKAILPFATHSDSPEMNDAQKFQKKLAEMAQPFGTHVDTFLDTLMLHKDIDTFDSRADRIRLLTLHASKGLEFPVVFIIGCEEDIIPHRIQGARTDVEEERRLLYVGMTRAQKMLSLTHTKSRISYGVKKMATPSRFLTAISESLIQRHKEQIDKKRKNDGQLRLF